MMQSKDILLCEALLKAHGYRVTGGRVALLVFLMRAKKPLSVAQIQEQMKHEVDMVTIYRALEDFSSSKIVAKINLQGATTYYEFIHDNHHHHHIVCERCGVIEDIELCGEHDLENKALAVSNLFRGIESHSLEFFGVCKKCETC